MEASSNEERFLFFKFKNCVLEYDYEDDEEGAELEGERRRQNLLQVLHNSDYREVIMKCINSDDLFKAFIRAAASNHSDVLRAFLDLGINPNVTDRQGTTALMWASRDGHEESTRLLLDYNTNVDIQNDNGWTALMYSSCCGRNKIVELLLSHDVDILPRDHNGESAFDLFCDEEIKEMIQNHVSTSYVLK